MWDNTNVLFYLFYFSYCYNCYPIPDVCWQSKKIKTDIALWNRKKNVAVDAYKSTHPQRCDNCMLIMKEPQLSFRKNMQHSEYMQFGEKNDIK